MPARHIVCSKCDGFKVGPDGRPCVECGGRGGSIFGEDRPRAEIEKDIVATAHILRMDMAELSRAESRFLACKPEMRAGCHAHVEACKSGVLYWSFRQDMLRKELIHCQALEEAARPDATRIKPGACS